MSCSRGRDLGKGAGSRTSAIVKPKPCKFEGHRLRQKERVTGPFRGVVERQERMGLWLQAQEGKAALEDLWNILNANRAFPSSKWVPSAS